MPNNHVILGLGGTGGNILRAFRTLLWQEHRNKEPRLWNGEKNQWSDPIANIGYLYVDSNDRELNKSDGLWQCLGESLALDKNERLLIRDADMEAALNNLKMNPGISGWIGEPDVLKVMIQNSRGSEGANQLRRFGRYLFAQSAARFASRIKELVAKLTEGGCADVTFHVCCTLGCGTGSGTVVDAISQIRKFYPNGKTHPIFIYALVTDQHIKGNANVGFFYPNQYAALCELNALRQGLWKPHDVLAYQQPQRIENLTDNFQSCFLISSINEKSEVSSKEEQEQMVASYIYQKTIALHEHTPKSLHQAETFEDFKAHTAVLKDRATTFGTFGIKRFRIPETEIREKLAFTFAIQAVLQSLYNNWSENGYVKAELPRDLPEIVTAPERNHSWCLTDEHLKLSKDFALAGGKDWASIGDDWANTIGGRQKFLVKHKEAEKVVWLGDLREFAKTHFEKNFRNRGVVQYYEDKQEAISDYARQIRKFVETDLFERWKNGEDSVTDTGRILDALITHLERRKTTFDQQREEAAKVEKKATERIRDAEDKWNRVGFLAQVLTHAHEKILGEFAVGLTDKHAADTELVACSFAKELVQRVISQLNDFRTNVTTVKAVLGELVDRYGKEASARITNGQKIDYRAKDVRLIEPDQINQTIRYLQNDPRIQQGQCGEVRREIAAKLGVASEEQSFTSLSKKIDESELDSVVFGTSDQAATTAHAALFSGTPTELRRIIGQNIIEKLHEQYPTVTSELKKNIETLVQSSAAYLTFDDRQPKPATVYQSEMPEMPRRAIVVFLPKADHLASFREQLKRELKAANEQEVEVVDSDYNQNEILLISVSFWFELRYVQPLVGLQKYYDDFIRPDEWKKIHQIHLENHRVPIQDLLFGPGVGELPRLHLLTGPVSAAQAFKYLLLGRILGYLRLEENARHIKTLLFAIRDEDGFAKTTPIDLNAAELEEATKRLDWGTFGEIQKAIENTLRDSYQSPDKKKTLLDALDKLSKDKWLERDKRTLDPVFQAFSEKVQSAKALVEQF